VSSAVIVYVSGSAAQNEGTGKKNNDNENASSNKHLIILESIHRHHPT